MNEQQTINRRKFIGSTALLMAGTWINPVFAASKYTPKLSFSTLACPNWEFAKVIQFAKEHGYTGLEFRGIQGVLDLTKSPVFQSTDARKNAMTQMKDAGLQFVGMGSSTNLHEKDLTKRTQQLDEAKRYIDLAAQVGCPFIRVFPNIFPKDQSREETMELIKKGLLELADYTKGTRVTVLMETHGEVVQSADLLEIMQAVNHKKAGLVWDISNMWNITGEDPAQMYQRLKPYIRHVHVKDARKENNKLKYTFLGKGAVPIFPALELLFKDQYKGFYSFEWEKMWHPELEEPEFALADYPRAMKAHFNF